MKFVFFVEGYTEKMVVPDFIRRHLAARLPQRVGVQAVRFNGCAEFLKKIADRARAHLDGPARGKIIAAIGLLDLYGPDKLGFYDSSARTARERAEWGKKKIEDDVNHEKFRMFFAVHEIEAWLLSQPALFPEDVLNALPGRIEDPESVDFDEPPAKLLSRLFRKKTGRRYKKTIDGSKYFRNLDPDVPYQKCPFLRSMLDELVTLGQQAGMAV